LKNKAFCAESYLAFRLEPCRRLKQPYMAFLNEVPDGEAVIAELAGHGDDETHMRHSHAVQRFLIPVIAPVLRQFLLFVALQIGRCHGQANEFTF
jgi:hypothetical protein